MSFPAFGPKRVGSKKMYKEKKEIKRLVENFASNISDGIADIATGLLGKYSDIKTTANAEKEFDRLVELVAEELNKQLQG